MTCSASGDGGVVMAGEGHFALKLDSVGNVAWKRFYNRTGVTCYDILKTNDGGFLACGLIRSFESFSILNEAYIMKIDFEGNIQWDTIINSGYYHVLYSISPNNSEHFTLAGSKYNFSTDTSKCSIVKIDINGKFLWTKQYKINNNGAVANIVTSNINGSIITGTTNDTSNNYNNIFILKIDSNGNKYYEKIFNVTSNEVPYDLKLINNNKYAITIYNNFAKNLLIDSTGKIITEKIYPSQYYTIFQSILPMGNGDIIFGGTGRFFGFEEDVYIIRTDSMLNSTPIGILSNNNLSPKNFKLYQNFPNPFNPTTTIKYEIPKDAEITIKVYDLLGREVFSINEYKKAGSYEVKFDGSNLASGMYLYSFEVSDPSTGSGQGYRDTKKMVLLK